MSNDAELQHADDSTRDMASSDEKLEHAEIKYISSTRDAWMSVAGS